MRSRWLVGCAGLAVSACGGVVSRSTGSDDGGTTSGGSTSSMAGSTSSTGGATSVGGSRPAKGGATSMGGGKPTTGGTTSVGGQPWQDCGLLVPAPAVLGCVRESGVLANPEATVNVSVPNAEITSEVVGALEGGCLEPLLQLEPNGPALSGQAMSWTISDGKRLFDVEVVVEGNMIPSLGGQKVSLSYVYQFGGFGPTQRQLSLATLMSPSHGVWIAEGGGPQMIGNRPMQLERGDAVCAAHEQCGSYSRYDIDAIEPLSMEQHTVPHGQTIRFGPWVIVHGGYAEQTTAAACPDWFVEDVHVAILGLM